MQNNTPVTTHQFFNRERHCEDLDQSKKPRKKKKNDRYHRRGKKTNHCYSKGKLLKIYKGKTENLINHCYSKWKTEKKIYKLKDLPQLDP